MLHALGFIHEKSRDDRDDFVRINRANIAADAIGEVKITATDSFCLSDQFSKYSASSVTNQSTSYDYGSVMHYGLFAFRYSFHVSKFSNFSSNGQATLTATRQLPTGVRIGQRDSASSIDYTELNRMYNCQGSNAGGWGQKL